jgi:PERQ amino acid-rich with GYF domain-containing protein
MNAPYSGGKWTTIGANGKASAAATGTVPATASTSLAPASPSVIRPASTTPQKPKTPSNVTSPTKTSNGTAADEPPPPTTELLKWVKDALKGWTGGNGK